jgi:hypothetical protein
MFFSALFLISCCQLLVSVERRFARPTPELAFSALACPSFFTGLSYCASIFWVLTPRFRPGKGEIARSVAVCRGFRRYSFCRLSFSAGFAAVFLCQIFLWTMFLSKTVTSSLRGCRLRRFGPPNSPRIPGAAGTDVKCWSMRTFFSASPRPGARG